MSKISEYRQHAKECRGLQTPDSAIALSLTCIRTHRQPAALAVAKARNPAMNDARDVRFNCM